MLELLTLIATLSPEPQVALAVVELDFEGAEAMESLFLADPSGWTTSGGPGGRALELTGGDAYQPPHRSPRRFALVKDVEFGDFVLDVDIRQTGREYGHRDACVFFGYQDPANFYYVHLATKADAHAHSVFIVNDAPRTSIAATRTDGVQWGGDWHHVRVQRSGGTISVFFDDMTTAVMTADDATHEWGRIGIGSFDDTAQFDDLVVCADESRTRSALVEQSLIPGTIIDGEPILHAIESRMEHHGVPGVSVAVIDQGQIEWARGYGVADIETGAAVTTETLFQAASISKPVAAAAALTLIDDGTLSLDTQVNSRLATWSIPEHSWRESSPVTVRGLLSHSAGLTVHGFPGYTRFVTKPTVVQVLNGVGNTAPVAADIEPGTRYRYSGGGYTVLQLLMTDVTGRPFPDLMKDRVLEPAGMASSLYAQPLPEALHDRAASGHAGHGRRVAGQWHVYPEMAAAGLWTTPSDLARFALAVCRARAGAEGALLSAPTAEAMLTPVFDGYALGLMNEGDDDARFGHGGANAGFRCSMTAFRDGRGGVVVMTNSDNGGGLASEIVRAVARVYGWEDPELDPVIKTVITLDDSVLERCVGAYQIPDGPTFRIVIEDGHLVAVLGPQRHELLAETETTFFLRTDSTPVRFEVEDAEVTAIVFGADLRAAKIQ